MKVNREGVMRGARRFVGAAGLVGAGVASAQTGGLDTSAVTTAITAAATAIGVIGGAVVAGPTVVKATWKWIRGAV